MNYKNLELSPVRHDIISNYKVPQCRANGEGFRSPC